MPISPKLAVKEVQDVSVLTARSTASLFRRPFYVRDILIQMETVGVGSLAVCILTGFFTGAVLTLQSSKTLSTFDAVGFTGSLVAISLVRELGPVLASLMVAGRVGSGIASELGSMVVSEQINAMRALGTDPTRKLVTPRMIASVTMLPLLTIVCNGVGMTGGWLIARYKLLISSSQYWSDAINALEFSDVVGTLIKPIVFGFIISMTGCYIGLRTYGGTEGVGRSTTQAVVSSSIMI